MKIVLCNHVGHRREGMGIFTRASGILQDPQVIVCRAISLSIQADNKPVDRKNKGIYIEVEGEAARPSETTFWPLESSLIHACEINATHFFNGPACRFGNSQKT